MLPNRGVGVYRGNRSESRYPGLLRLALRDRKVRHTSLKRHLQDKATSLYEIFDCACVHFDLVWCDTQRRSETEEDGERDFGRANLIKIFTTPAPRFCPVCPMLPPPHRRTRLRWSDCWAPPVESKRKSPVKGTMCLCVCILFVTLSYF